MRAVVLAFLLTACASQDGSDNNSVLARIGAEAGKMVATGIGSAGTYAGRLAHERSHIRPAAGQSGLSGAGKASVKAGIQGGAMTRGGK